MLRQEMHGHLEVSLPKGGAPGGYGIDEVYAEVFETGLAGELYAASGGVGVVAAIEVAEHIVLEGLYAYAESIYAKTSQG